MISSDVWVVAVGVALTLAFIAIGVVVVTVYELVVRALAALDEIRGTL